MRDRFGPIHGVLAAALVLAVQGAASAAIVYTSQPIFLSGSAYAVSSSFATSQVASNGVVAGTTNRAGSGSGKDAWLYNPNNNTFNQIGLFDASGTGVYENGSARVSSIAGVNTLGEAAGNSNIYAKGTSSNGEDAWFYNPATNTSINIGLQTAAYQASTAGYYYSTATGISAGGTVIGTSYIFNGGPFTVIPSQNPYKSAWFYNSAAAVPSTTLMGFTGDGYNTGGLTNTSVTAINSSGQAIGTSVRYDAYGNTLGQDAWIEATATTTPTPLQIGLTTAAYQETGNSESSSVIAINDAGDVVGTSARYSGYTSQGIDGWMYTPTAGTVQIGLIGTGYENSGFRQTNVNYLNAQGQAAGTSFRYSGATQIGQDAWVYDSTASVPTTIPIGLTGGVYEQTPGGVRNSYVSALSNNGQVAGYSARYNGTTGLGNDAWLYTPGTSPHAGTIQVGLTGTIAGSTMTYTRSTDGYEYSGISAINNTGLVAGYSYRYSGNNQNGQDAWVYDSISGITYTLDFSQSSVTGATSTTVSFLTDSGLAVGYYTKYSAGTSLGNYAFAWSENGGFVDLSSTAITPAGVGSFANLTQALKAAANGSIVAYGVPSTAAGTGVYFLTSHLLGDVNGDGKVDLSDLNIVLNDLGTTNSAWSAGNFDGAATIDLTDLNDVLNNLGVGSTASATGAISLLAVPEPASLSMLGAALVLVKKRRRA